MTLRRAGHYPPCVPPHAPDNAHDDGAPAPASSTPAAGDRVLLVVFWVWAGLLLVAAVSQLAGWDGVLDLLDVKRWFAR